MIEQELLSSFPLSGLIVFIYFSRGLYPIRVKLSDWVGWHGQTLFVRAFLATHNGTKFTGNVADYCPPLAGVQGVEKEHENNAGKTKSR